MEFSNQDCMETEDVFTSYCSAERSQNKIYLQEEYLTIEKMDITEMPSTQGTSDKMLNNINHETVSLSSDNSYSSATKSSISRYNNGFKSYVKKTKDYSKKRYFNASVKSIARNGNFGWFTRSNSYGSSKNFNYRMQSWSKNYNRFKRFPDDGDFIYRGFSDATGYYRVNANLLLSKPLRDTLFKRYVCRNYSESLKFLRRNEYKKYRNMQKILSSLRYTYYRRDYFYNYKWKRPVVPKEQLDDELDAYMAEAKSKSRTNKTEIDSFIEEYMSETEKSLNQYDPLDLFQ